MMHLPHDWTEFACCSSCAQDLSPDVVAKIDEILDRASTQGGQQMQRIIDDIGKALTSKPTPLSFFSEEGQHAIRITHSGIHWRANFDRKKRAEEIVRRLAQIQPGASLGLSTKANMEELQHKYMDGI